MNIYEVTIWKVMFVVLDQLMCGMDFNRGRREVDKWEVWTDGP